MAFSALDQVAVGFGQNGFCVRLFAKDGKTVKHRCAKRLAIPSGEFAFEQLDHMAGFFIPRFPSNGWQDDAKICVAQIADNALTIEFTIEYICHQLQKGNLGAGTKLGADGFRVEDMEI